MKIFNIGEEQICENLFWKFLVMQYLNLSFSLQRLTAFDVVRLELIGFTARIFFRDIFWFGLGFWLGRPVITGSLIILSWWTNIPCLSLHLKYFTPFTVPSCFPNKVIYAHNYGHEGTQQTYHLVVLMLLQSIHLQQILWTQQIWLYQTWNR